MRDWRNPNFEWDDGNEDHIVRHDVYPDEAEEVFRDRTYIRREGPRYLVHGRDSSGRYLLVVCEVRGSPRRVRVVTARSMTPVERRRYERHI